MIFDVNRFYFQSILQQQQDTSIRRLGELRDQIKLDRQAKEQLEVLHQKEMRNKNNRIEELTLQVRTSIFQRKLSNVFSLD